MLCYVAEDANGRVDLFVRQIAGGALVKLTDDAAREESPRFSPDGDRIAFTRRERRGRPAGAPHRPLPWRRPARHDSWRRRRRVVARRPATGVHARARRGRRRADHRRVSTGRMRVCLLQSDSAYPFVRQPAWSPDGRDLAIVRGTGGIAGEIWSVPASGGTPRRLFTDAPPGFADSPMFTRRRPWLDSYRRIAAARPTSGSIPLHGGPPDPAHDRPGAGHRANRHAHGQVAFVNSRWRNTLELHAMDGSGSRTLVTHSPFLWGPAFSPDGTEIAVSRSEVDGSWHIWSVSASGGTPRRLTATEGGEVYPRYGPDGQSLFFHTWKTPRRIGRVGRQGGRAELLPFGDGNDAFPDVSPDGRLAGDHAHGKGCRAPVHRCRRRHGGAARLLTTTPGAVGALVAGRSHHRLRWQPRVQRRHLRGLP